MFDTTEKKAQSDAKRCNLLSLPHRFQEVSTAMDNQAAKLWNLRAGKVQTLQLYFEKNRRVAA